jgi:hypothetical protein
MGDAPSKEVLGQFYLPLFLIAYVLFYFIATNQPAIMKNVPMLAVMRTWYTTSPLKYGALMAGLTTLGALAFYQDVKVTLPGGEDKGYHAELYTSLLPKEYYGAQAPAHAGGLNPLGFKNTYT